MTFQDLLKQRIQLTVYYTAEHILNNITTVDHSCQNCYPPPFDLPVAFQNFWNWIRNYYFADTYTSYTIQALPIFYQTFQQDPNNFKGNQVVKLAIELLYSVRYQRKPDPVTTLIFHFLN